MAQVQPAVAPIQTRFDGGAISPRLRGRFDSDLYKKALAECSNFEPLPQGSLRMRSGSKKERLLTGDVRTRLVQIRMSTGQDYLVELLEKGMHLYSLSGGSSAIETVGLSDLIYNGDFSLYGAGWLGLGKVGNYLQDNDTSVSFTDFNGNLLGIAAINAANGGGVLYQRIVVPFAANVRIKFDFAANITQNDGRLKVKISTSDPAGWVDRIANGGESFVYDAKPAGLVTAGSGAVPPGTFTHVDLGTVALAAGIYYVSFQISNVNAYTATFDNVSLQATFAGAQILVPAPWSANEVGDVRFVTETGRDRTIFVHPQHKPWALLYGGTPGNWTFGDVVFTSLPIAWGDAGSANVPVGWSWQGQTATLAAPNWPATVDMADGRVYYGGEPAQKNRMLASKSGSSDDFTIGSNPGDALDFKLATKGAIRWLRSHRVMLAGTDLGQHSITGSKGTPLVGDIQARPESGFPSSSVQALVAGTQALYVSGDLRRIRAAAFDLQTNGWESKDVTFIAEHLTAALIKELHFAWTPDSAIIALLQDGTLVACTFEPVEQVTAFWTASVGAPIVSAAASQGPLGAYLWMAVNRGGKIYLEKLNLSESTEALGYLDASISGVADANGDFAGLDHLIGQTINAVANGGFVKGILVDGAGTIHLGADLANATVVAGLPYLARAKTLPRDLRHGKAQSPKIGVVMNNSALPLINGKRPSDRSPSTPMNTVEPLITGKAQVGNLGWSGEDSITLEQDLPFRTEICALYSATQTEQNL